MIDRNSYFENLRLSGLSTRILTLFKERYTVDVQLKQKVVDRLMGQYKNQFERLQPINPTISKIYELFPNRIQGCKVLIVGLGLSVTYDRDFIEFGATVWGIEPYAPYHHIQIDNARILQFPEEQIVSACAENIPFEDSFFDFVYCYTVIEHVQDVEQSLAEMHRVTKKGGVIFIETPDYRVPQEPHYKLQFPTYIPLIAKIYTILPSKLRKLVVLATLKIQGRSTNFLKSLTFLDAKLLKQLFYSKGWSFLEANFPPDLSQPKNIMTQFMLKLGISRNCWFFITK